MRMLSASLRLSPLLVSSGEGILPRSTRSARMSAPSPPRQFHSLRTKANNGQRKRQAQCQEIARKRTGPRRTHSGAYQKYQATPGVPLP